MLNLSERKPTQWHNFFVWLRMTQRLFWGQPIQNTDDHVNICWVLWLSERMPLGIERFAFTRNWYFPYSKSSETMVLAYRCPLALQSPSPSLFYVLFLPKMFDLSGWGQASSSSGDLTEGIHGGVPRTDKYRKPKRAMFATDKKKSVLPNTKRTPQATIKWGLAFDRFTNEDMTKRPKQVRFVSVKAWRPYHPSRDYVTV